MKTLVKISVLLLFALLWDACSHKTAPVATVPTPKDTIPVDTVLQTDTSSSLPVPTPEYTPFEKKLQAYGLVDVQTLDSSIKVSLKYATTDNFMHRNMYGDFDKAYLQKEVAEKLVKAQHYLKDSVPWYSLIIYDAVRPRIVQQWMWDSVNVPDRVRYKYLSNPQYGSLHNFGAAVDVSIINDSTGKALDMGTPFDCFCELAYPYFEKKMLANGKLSRKAYQNRLLLRYVMKKAGFSGISTEWWHFNSCSRKTARRKYPIIENFEGLPEKTTTLAEHKTPTTDNTDTTQHNISFRVQIKISKKPLSPSCPCFKGLEVWQYYHNGYYKYTAGHFTDLNQAVKFRNQLRKKGFHDCFIAAFDNGKRISFKDAYKIREE